MKSVVVCTLLLLAAATSFSQQIDSVQPSMRQMYLSKSKQQKKAASVMLGGGVGMTTAGLIIFMKNFCLDIGPGPRTCRDDSPANVGVFLSLVGFGSILCSIPLFIASGRNKGKAAKLSAGLKLQRTMVPIGLGFVSHSTPALSLRLNF